MMTTDLKKKHEFRLLIAQERKRRCSGARG